MSKDRIRLKHPGRVLRTLGLVRDSYFPNLPILYRLPWGGWLLLQNDELGKSIYWGNLLEQDGLDLIANLLQPGMVFFDIGANQGLYSIVASQAVGLKGRVYAFEPISSEYQKLRTNIKLNFAKNIVTEQMAVGNLDGITQMFACDASKGSYSSLVRPAVESGVSMTKVDVPITSLDSYINFYQIKKIDILKIDVEGAEQEVLKGGKRLFTSEDRRPIVLCEFSDRRTAPWGYRAREIADTLVNYGYTWFEPIPGGIRHHTVQDYYDYDDLLAVPKEKLHIVKPFIREVVKVLFINPKYPIHHPPLGLGYLSSYLKKYLDVPVEIRLFDEVIDTNIIQVLREFKPDIVGISVVTPTFSRACELCRQVRTVSNAPIIAGGPHITALPAESISKGPFDVGVIGEGEATFLELVEHFLQTGRIKSEYIRGIIYKEGDLLVRTPPRPLIADIDTIPSPDRGLFNMSHYTQPGRIAHGLYAKGTSMMPSRGCPFNKCDFCSSSLIWGDTVRFFSPEYVVNEIESIVNEYDLNFIIFLDDNFTTNIKWLEKLQVIWEKRGISKKIRFDCESISNFINDEKAAILKRMGCVRIEFGFESGCPRILQILKAGKSTIEHNKRGIEVCHRHGIQVLGNMIYGYIDETREEFEESLRWFCSQPIDYVAPHLYTPYPGTSGWKKCIDRGLLDPEKINDWGQFTTHGSNGSICVNAMFLPKKGERSFQEELHNEFANRNWLIVVDQGLSLFERLNLYSQVVIGTENKLRCNSNRLKFLLFLIGWYTKTKIWFLKMFGFSGLKPADKKRLNVLIRSLLREGIKKTVLYGASDTGREMFKSLEKVDIEVICFIDGDIEKQGGKFCEREIIPLSKIGMYNPDGVIITSRGFEDEIYEKIKYLENKGIKVKKIFGDAN